jgi:steroid 5-alpha reductase family enzyme
MVVGALAISAGGLAVFMTALFAVAMRTNNNGTADVGYGIAFIVVILATAVQRSAMTAAETLVVALPVIWGLRLAWRIGRKNLKKPEDFRYAAWRKDWGDSFAQRSFLQIYMLQGAIVFLIALPVTLMLIFPTAASLNAITIAGAILWLVGFYFQAVGDAQLDAFLSDKANHGRIMTCGLWRYSRHPNYFGESLMWWGIAIAAVPLSSVPLLGFVGPVLITFLLLKVSGVPLLEKRWAGRADWEDYKARTSVFIPLPPRDA